VLTDRKSPDALASLLVVWQVQQAAASGGSLTERELLRQGISSEQWRRISDRLLKRRIITTTVQGDFVLSYDLNHLSLEQLAKARSEEHTSELQSRENLVCSLLLEKKKDKRAVRSRTNVGVWKRREHSRVMTR